MLAEPEGTDVLTAIDGFRADAYQRLFAAPRRSLERTGGDLSGHISVAGPGIAERDAIAGLTGKRLTAGAGRVRVGLGDLDADVRRAAGLPRRLRLAGASPSPTR
jgi:hypothetical protein